MNMKSPFIGNCVNRILLAVFLLGSVLGLSITTMAQTGEPSREPILRIETGMHTAAIAGIGVDATGRFLVTASGDKTARIWDIATGELLRVLRPPLGAGIEGQLSSVAISPDGNTVAVSGNTGLWDKSFSIYLFDRASGRLVRRLSGLPSTVYHLVFSPDGKYFAATLGQGGVHVYETSGWQQIGADADYRNRSFAADFDRSGRLVTSCFDGFIRLYAVSQTGLRLAKKKASGAKQPFAVKFSPDGSKIAVGFYESTNVNVLSAADLSLLFAAADTSGVNNGDLFSVAWSATGDILYASGQYRTSGGNVPICFWTNGGRGGHQETNASLSVVNDIQPLPNGGVIYGASDPAWGIIDASGKRTRFVVSGIADYRGLRENFRVSNDGTEFQFGYQKFGKLPTQFSLSERRLIAAEGNNARLQSPSTDALNITDWRSDDNVTFHEPKLNGSKLALWDKYETSISLAIAPDNSKFLLGTGGFIYLFDRTGKELWKVSAPGAAWSLNISGDGRLATAAFGDGTIRWYSTTDGKELLAFFPHADRKRWVLWTPSGYYDASPGAEDLIGWHVNNGKDQAADFFPVGQFRSTYYRPDVIARILQTGDERLALQQSNEAAGRKEQESTVAQQLPPVVEIMSPSDSSEVSSTEIAVRFRVRTPSAEPVTSVKALVDGRPMGARQLVREAATNNVDGMRELRVTVPERDSEIAIIAENRFTSSVPATVRVKWHSATAARPEAFVVKPKLYIFAVGVSQHADSKFNLKLADKDAGDFVKAMMAQKDLLYREVVVKLLTNEKATKDDVLDGLDWIRQETTSNDVAMVFFAGHGVNDQNNYYYFCPYNVDPSRLLRTGVAFSDIKKTVSAIAGKALFFVDSCHSGNAIGLAARRGPLDINIVINELSSAENGVVVFSASTGSESSYEREEWNNGAFTKALVEGLGGAASIGNTGRITYNMLNVYISERVKELTKGQQHPTMISPQTVPDFPIAVKK